MSDVQRVKTQQRPVVSRLATDGAAYGGIVFGHSRTLDTHKNAATYGFYKRKPSENTKPGVCGPGFTNWLFSLVAGAGFEPATFGL